jgi:hypothetical protein
VHRSVKIGQTSKRCLHLREIAGLPSNLELGIELGALDLEVCRANRPVLSSDQDPSLDPNGKELNSDQGLPANEARRPSLPRSRNRGFAFSAWKYSSVFNGVDRTPFPPYLIDIIKLFAKSPFVTIFVAIYVSASEKIYDVSMLCV